MPGYTPSIVNVLLESKRKISEGGSNRDLIRPYQSLSHGFAYAFMFRWFGHLHIPLALRDINLTL